MKHLWWAGFVVFFGLQLSARGPIIVGGGAGESEYSVLFSRSHLIEIFNECLQITCHLDPNQSQLLSDLQLRAETAPRVLFVSRMELGDRLYDLSGDHAFVQINRDLLWLDDEATKAYDVGAATTLWLEILSHDIHPPQDLLEALKRNLEEVLRQDITRVHRLLHPDMSFEILHWKRVDGVDRLFLRDNVLQSVEVTNLILSSLPCSKSLKIFSPNWFAATEGETELIMSLNFGYRWSCDGESGNGHAVMSLHAFKNKNHLFEIDPTTIETNIKKGMLR